MKLCVTVWYKTRSSPDDIQSAKRDGSAAVWQLLSIQRTQRCTYTYVLCIRVCIYVHTQTLRIVLQLVDIELFICKTLGMHKPYDSKKKGGLKPAFFMCRYFCLGDEVCLSPSRIGEGAERPSQRK